MGGGHKFELVGVSDEWDFQIGGSFRLGGVSDWGGF